MHEINQTPSVLLPSFFFPFFIFLFLFLFCGRSQGWEREQEREAAFQPGRRFGRGSKVRVLFLGCACIPGIDFTVDFCPAALIILSCCVGPALIIAGIIVAVLAGPPVREPNVQAYDAAAAVCSFSFPIICPRRITLVNARSPTRCIWAI